MSRMRIAIVAMFVCATLTPCRAADLIEQPIQPPSYDAIPKAQLYASRAEYEAAVHDSRFRLSRVSYESDGLTVFAYLYGPAHSSKTKLPVVVFNRGSYVWKEFAGEYLALFHRLASAGFLVIAPMYRGSGGAEGKDEMGGADLDDLLAVTNVIGHLSSADTAHVFMYGESRGGMMTYLAIKEHFPMRAAAVYGGLTDIRSLTAPGGKFASAAHAIWPDFDEHHEEIAARRSAIDWPEKFETPVLIMHGGADRDVSPSQSLELASRLQQLGKTYGLVVHAGSDHRLSDWQTERDMQAVEWFRRYMEK
jgi:dipeptidyl aminopeptidase/acylaminoacyl peptidase